MARGKPRQEKGQTASDVASSNRKTRSNPTRSTIRLARATKRTVLIGNNTVGLGIVKTDSPAPGAAGGRVHISLCAFWQSASTGWGLAHFSGRFGPKNVPVPFPPKGTVPFSRTLSRSALATCMASASHLHGLPIRKTTIPSRVSSVRRAANPPTGFGVTGSFSENPGNWPTSWEPPPKSDAFGYRSAKPLRFGKHDPARPARLPKHPARWPYEPCVV